MDRLLGERHQQITIRVLRLNQRGQIKYLRALQGHAPRSESRSNTAGQREDPFWMDGLYLSRRMKLGLPFRCRRRLTRCRKRRKSGRHTRFFTAVNPLCETDVDHSYESGQPRMVPNKMEWSRHQDAVYWFDLTSAQEKGLVWFG